MRVSLKKVVYHGLCACASMAIASYAMMPVSAATANALSYRGGQISCPLGGCHDKDAHCEGNASCESQLATACFVGDDDRNHLRCGPDSGLCTDQGCNGADITCGGN
jgi:hypothetical protein